MDKKSLFLATLVGAVMLTGCSGKQNGMGSMTPTRKFHKVTAGDVTLYTNYAATIEGCQDIEVYPQVGGTLQELRVTEGQRVKKGEIMFVIDQVPYKAALEAAQASLDQAKAGLEQAKAGKESAKASLEAAKASLETAQAGLKQTQASYDAALATRKSAQASLSTAQLNYDSRKKLYDQKVVSSYDLQTAENSLTNAKAAVSQCDAQVSQANGAVAASKGQISQVKSQISQCEAQISAAEAQIQSGNASIEQCEAQVVNAQNNLSYTEVKSPADGIVGTLPYRQGALVSSNMPQPLTTVSDNNSMFVYFSINENKMLELIKEYGSIEDAIKNMSALKLTLSDGTEYNEEGRIESISGVIDKKTGSTQVRAVFPNSEGKLHSGNTGSIVMPTTYKDVLTVPQVATAKQQDKLVVYKKVSDTYARPQIIEVESKDDGKNYIVKSGLKAGDEIISAGVGLLHGDSILLKDDEKEANKK